MRLVPALTAAALTLGLVAAEVPAAQADPIEPTPPAVACQVSNAQLNKSTVTVRASSYGGKPVTVDVSATITNCDSYDAYLEFGGPNISTNLYPSDDDPTNWSGTVVLDPNSLHDNNAGNEDGIAYFGTDAPEQELGASLNIKRGSELSSEAPRKVKKNKNFYVHVVMFVDSWEDDWQYPGQHKKVIFQSRTSGSEWKTVKNYYTSKGDKMAGDVTLKRKVSKYTCFRWVYAGSSTIAPAASDSNCVKVDK